MSAASNRAAKKAAENKKAIEEGKTFRSQKPVVWKRKVKRK